MGGYGEKNSSWTISINTSVTKLPHSETKNDKRKEKKSGDDFARVETTKKAVLLGDKLPFQPLFFDSTINLDTNIAKAKLKHRIPSGLLPHRIRHSKHS